MDEKTPTSDDLEPITPLELDTGDSPAGSEISSPAPEITSWQDMTPALAEEAAASPEITPPPSMEESIDPSVISMTSEFLAPDSESPALPSVEESIPESPPLPAVAAPIDPLSNIREYSERTPPGKPTVPASLPFNLRIDGHMSVTDQAKFLDLLSRENFGVREMDLEPQLKAGRILIPRISEYGVVLLVQALRDASVTFRTELAESEEMLVSSAMDTEPFVHVEESGSPSSADAIPLLLGADLPGGQAYEVIDTLVVTATLSSSAVEAHVTPEYEDLLESLQREIRHRAKIKGADAIVHFQFNLTTLQLPSSYRLTAMGTAVRYSL